MAVHYPADVEIFALCCIDDHNAGRDIDKKIKQLVSDKLAKTSSQYGEFRATSESPLVLTAMLDLEQLLGREIVWVRGVSWETMIRKKKYIPNQVNRFCTSILKIDPIFQYLYYRDLLPCKMRIGFRMDEVERSEKPKETDYKYTERSYRLASGKWISRWSYYGNWRETEYPLIENNVWHKQVQDFWNLKNIRFPQDSNCQLCFWKPLQQLAKNFQDHSALMKWAAVQEVIAGNQFKKEASIFNTSKIGIQKDFFFGTGSGCQAGFCTD